MPRYGGSGARPVSVAQFANLREGKAIRFLGLAEPAVLAEQLAGIDRNGGQAVAVIVHQGEFGLEACEQCGGLAIMGAGCLQAAGKPLDIGDLAVGVGGVGAERRVGRSRLE